MAPVSIQSILKCFIGRREAEIAENGPKIYAEIRSKNPSQRCLGCRTAQNKREPSTQGSGYPFG